MVLPSRPSLARLCLLVSLLLHLLGLGAVQLLLSARPEQQRLRLRFVPLVPGDPARFGPVPAPAGTAAGPGTANESAWPANALSGLGRDGGVSPLAGIADGANEPGLGPLGGWLLRRPAIPGEKGAWHATGEELSNPTLGPSSHPGPEVVDQGSGLPLALDPVELDALARRRTIVLVDPSQQRLKQAWLHLPAYENNTTPELGVRGCRYLGGAELSQILDLLEVGARLPDRIPVTSTVHYLRLGGCTASSTSDPIHRFGRYPGRHLLTPAEMKEYPVLLLRYIDVESTEAMVRYLLDGGFGVVDRGQLVLLRRGLQQQVGDRVREILVGVEHPLFHAWFEVTRYIYDYARGCPNPENRRPGGPGMYSPPCVPVVPLPGLALDGRLVAVVTPDYNQKCPCPANRLYVNILAYALTQPSSMGGRYVAEEPERP